MIWPQDALLLAATKIKTRRLRLIITVIVAGILFVMLTSLSLVANGVFNSIESFSEEGLGKRYILQASPVISEESYQKSASVQSDPTKIAQLKAAFETYKKDKASAAKRLGVEYDPKAEQPPVFTDSSNNQEIADSSHPLFIKLFSESTLDEMATAQLKADIELAKKEYGAIGVYKSLEFSGGLVSGGMANGQDVYTRHLIREGKEEINLATSMNYSNDLFSQGLKSVEAALEGFSDEVLAQFLLPGQNFELKDGVVPIVIPYKAAEDVLELSPLKPGSKAQVQLDRTKEVRQNIAGKTFQVCLRNRSSSERQTLAKQQQDDYETNKGKKDYVRPDLMYDISSQPCQDVVVSRDVRTATKKAYDAKFEQFEREFGKVDPAQRMVTFKVVGVSPDQPSYAGFSVSDIIKGIFSTYLGRGWYVPVSAAELLPEYASDFKREIGEVHTFSSNLYYIEFADAESARRMTDEKSCLFQFPTDGSDPASACIEAGQTLTLFPFGSSSLALEQARAGFRSVFPKVLLVVAGISALIMMGTVGKIIADSRRETAVFRAIGAKRLDIAQIYLTYTLLISMLISVVAIGLGFMLASFINSQFADMATVEAIVSFNAQDLDRRFGLIGVRLQEIMLLVGFIIGGSLVSALLPLLTNLRRSPIRDMRDER